MTYKKRIPSASAIKQQREEETGVEDPEAMEAILEALGFTPALVYEKRRQTWRLGKTEIVIDVLPFGLFMEIEGRVNEIKAVERKLGLKGLRAEHATYPQLTQKHGKALRRPDRSAVLISEEVSCKGSVVKWRQYPEPD